MKEMLYAPTFVDPFWEDGQDIAEYAVQVAVSSAYCGRKPSGDRVQLKHCLLQRRKDGSAQAINQSSLHVRLYRRRYYTPRRLGRWNVLPGEAVHACVVGGKKYAKSWM
jgi:hypothetical protein